MNTNDDGLVIVYTGAGKGKTTAALGLCLRAVGHGNKVGLIQFIKSDWPYGEMESLKQLRPEVEVMILGAGCIGIMGDDKPIEEHRQAARMALVEAQQAVLSDRFDVLILDEINIAVHLGLFEVDEVCDLIASRPKRLDLVLTGRQADPKIIALADLVTEMKEIKHPFASGRMSKKGIDH
ncbi:MAG: cob(I)yrinic acid a,c-diamide adenosyltransferase [FCB group bacterium]|nr:cob(I)yrinic acid a,c-diamide adenosyltransferase [FCB group bacterium]